MSVPENDWIWDNLNDAIAEGVITYEEADKMDFEEVYAWVMNNWRERMAVLTGVVKKIEEKE